MKKIIVSIHIEYYIQTNYTINCLAITQPFSTSITFKVEPYSIHGSFLKLEYLKTEFSEDSGTYATVKVTSHSYRIMVNLSINDYFEVMRQPLRTYLDVFRFFWKNVKTYPLLENESLPYDYSCLW